MHTHRSLGKFIKKKFKTNDVAFGQLNEQFIREYQDFVLIEQGYAMDTVRHYLAILKKICKIAFKEGISERFHFAHYKLPKQKETTPKALSRESFEKIRDLEISPNRPSIRFTRDLFLFACYTGTAYADVIRITGENLFTDEEGNQWLKYARRKTDYRARVKLLPEAIALIEKYRDENRDTLFPMQSAQMVKANMKGLRIMADIKEPMTYHSGRHSFASLITLEEGVPIETISRMLGHSNIQTTQIYARVTPKKLFEDMDKFIEAISNLKLII
jgi:site-specific recombinase XerD